MFSCCYNRTKLDVVSSVQVVQDLFSHLSSIPWSSAVDDAAEKYTQLSFDLDRDISEMKSAETSSETATDTSGQQLTPQPGVTHISSPPESLSVKVGEVGGAAMQDVSFDPDRMLSCSVESGHTLVHGAGGRGYGLGATAVTAGCYQWKVSSRLVKSGERLFHVLVLSQNSQYVYMYMLVHVQQQFVECNV